MTDKEIHAKFPRSVVRRPQGGPVFLERVQMYPVRLDTLLGDPGVYTIPHKRPLEAIVNFCVTKYWRGDYNISELAAMHNVPRLTMHRIVHRLTYWWVPT